MAQILFIDLCNELEKISLTTKRLEIQSILCAFLKKVLSQSPECLASTLFICNASVYPEYFNKELGIGDFIIQSAVSEVTGISVKEIKKQLVKLGDISLIAMKHRVNQLFIPVKSLTVAHVHSKLREISNISGKNSVQIKMNIMKTLISICSPLETKYMFRLFGCKLRIGLALQTILISLSLAYDESNYDIIKDCYDKHCDFEYLVTNLQKHGIENISNQTQIQPGIPLKPMLAEPSKNLTKALSKFENGDFLSEFKYDGERVQIHFFDGFTKLFSRNNEDITEKYPELCEIKLSEKSFILDCEAVAYKDEEILPFQILATRKKKNEEIKESKETLPSSFIQSKIENPVDSDTTIKRSKFDDEVDSLKMKEIRKIKNLEKIQSENVSICLFCFDILYFNGCELINMPLKERRKIFHDNFKELPSKFKFAMGLESSNFEDVEGHFKQALISSCEGLMLKSLDSIYKPSHRSNNWIKLKKDYLDSIGDSLDLVVLGVFYGKGKRTGVYGAFLLGTYNDENDKYEPCCKIGTGFSDSDLTNFHNVLSPLTTVSTSRINIEGDFDKPDLWLEPVFVWEVKAASLSLSPTYRCGEEKGISLRFPRFIRERTDKKAEEATTSNQLLSIYNDNNKKESEEDEFN